MKILFLLRQAPIVEPLGIMYLSAALKKEGHEVAVALGGTTALSRDAYLDR